MSLIGSISLTNPKDGVYLGQVNVNNYNLESNQIAYSTDGLNLSGLDLGDSITKNGNDLEACIFKNSYYVNDNNSSIKSKVDLCSQGDVVYISSGSFGEVQILINNKTNIALTGPQTGIYSSTICEVSNGFNVTGTSDLIRFSNLQIKGSSTFAGVGRYKLSGCVFSGSSGNINNIIFGQGCSKFITVNNCEFDEYCNITIPNTFLSAVYFVNCGFNGATINLNNTLAVQVIFNNCSGFASYPSTSNATFYGLNVLASGQSQVNTYDLKTTLINGSAYPPASGLSMNSQDEFRIPFCTDDNNVLEGSANLKYDNVKGSLELGTSNVNCNNINCNDINLMTINSSPYTPGIAMLNQAVSNIPFCTTDTNVLNGVDTLKYDMDSVKLTVGNDMGGGILSAGTIDNIAFINLLAGDAEQNTNKVIASNGVQGMKWSNLYHTVTNHFFSSQDQPTTGTSIYLFQSGVIANKLPDFKTLVICNFNFALSSNNAIINFQCVDGPQQNTLNQRFSRNGHHQISITFQLPANNNFTYDISILATVNNGEIEIDSNDFYNVTIQQFRDNLD